MNNEIQLSKRNTLSSTTIPQTVFSHEGDNGVQIANQGTVNVFLTNNSGPVLNAASTLCTEYYNLFVVGNEAFNEPSFTIGKSCSLTIAEGVAPDISTRFASLSTEAVTAIKSFPSLFASENHHNGCTDADHHAFYGRVVDVRIQENGIKIYFQKQSSFPQQRLNELARSLALHSASLLNELDRTHWAIKRINLIEELRCAGINV